MLLAGQTVWVTCRSTTCLLLSLSFSLSLFLSLFPSLSLSVPLYLLTAVRLSSLTLVTYVSRPPADIDLGAQHRGLQIIKTVAAAAVEGGRIVGGEEDVTLAERGLEGSRVATESADRRREERDLDDDLVVKERSRSSRFARRSDADRASAASPIHVEGANGNVAVDHNAADVVAYLKRCGRRDDAIYGRGSACGTRAEKRQTRRRSSVRSR